MTKRNNNDFKGERIHDQCSCCIPCCMPCICCFMVAEKLVQGLCIGMLWLLSCSCFRTSTITTIPQEEDGHIELCNLEETKDAYGQ